MGVAKYPKWWARNDIDNDLALGAHLGYMYFTQNSTTLLDILKRIESHYLSTSSPSILISDAAYYVALSKYAPTSLMIAI